MRRDVRRDVRTHHDGERPLPGGWADVDSDPAVRAEHELPHRQQPRVGHVPQPHPGHLHINHNYTGHCALRHIELCQLVSILVTCELERCLFLVQLKCVSFLSKKYPAAVQSSLTVFLWALSMVQWRKALLPADTETFQLEVVRSMAGAAWPTATSSRM